MRILNIRFRNLNSLAGDWSINLEDPAYEASGIFAITGPTGAGKSTILDAICLALYGSTPRLGKVTQAANDIMTRGASDCYAEVTFLTTQGKFRCHWSQKKKVRGKTAGELQPQKHEIFDADDKPLGESKKGVAAKVEELTGMDFTRFTQSTMLAQGRFATFLMADGRDRAPLLEKMTGTGIYSDISKYIFERHKEEQARLDAMDAELAHCHILSEEEEAALNEDCARLFASIRKTGEEEQKLTASLQTLQAHAALGQEHATLLGDKARLEDEEKAFAADRARLETARRALLFSGDCSSLLARQKEQEHDSAEAQLLGAALAPLTEDEQKKEGLHTLAEKRLSEIRTSHDDLMDTLKGVRDLDTQIKERGKEKAQLEKAEAEAARNEAATMASLTENEVLLEKARAALADAKEWLAGRASDAGLPEKLSALRQSATQLHEQKERLSARKSKLDGKRQELAQKEQGGEQLSKRHAELAAHLQQLDAAIESLETDRLNGLAGKLPSEWRKKQDDLNALDARLGRMLELAQKHSALQERCVELRAELGKLDASIGSETSLLRTEQGQLDALQSLQQELAESLALLERIRSYEEARLQLEDGVACPLCGALHHPFAEGNVPVPDGKKVQLQDCEQKIRVLNEALGKRRADLASLESRKEHTSRLLQEKSSEAVDVTARFETEAAVLPATLSLTEGLGDIALPKTLEDARTDCQSRLREIGNLLGNAEKQQEDLQKRRSERDEAHRKAELASQDLRKLEQEQAGLRAEIRTIELELENELALYEGNFDALRRELTPLGHIPQQAEDAPGILQSLAERLKAFQAKQSEAERLANTCAGLETKVLVGKQELQNIAQQLAGIREALAQNGTTLTLLLGQRHEIFGSKDATTEEQQSAERLRMAEEECKDRLASLNAVRKERDELATRIKALQKRIADRAEALAADERKILDSLAKAGFSNVPNCLEACLSEAERNALEERDRELKDGQTSLNARLIDNERRRTELEAMPEATAEELQNAVSELKARQAAMQEELGAKREKLESNARRKETASEVHKNRAIQEATCRRWGDLNKLLGSSDGQKFRNYAQELTFRHLLHHANRQLAFMTDRYTLVQTPKEALALSVIDHYHADAVRTSRNLSGGESFLVSLSLALGLAKMASRTVRVDSVFLDEGFGTLDENSLNMALDMLSNLRQQGKTIGIISHVQTIRERIGTRIQVEAEGNGRSRLSGPGIEKGK